MKQFIFILTLFIIILPISQTNAESGSKKTTHIVAVGDTLWAIAEANDVSIEDLISWNNLESTTIYSGQQLKLETESKNTKTKAAKTYTVKRGDTLIKIARSHDISLEDLIHSNSIKSDVIYPGNELIIEEDKITKTFSTAAAITTIHDEGISSTIYEPPVVNEPPSKPSTKKSESTVTTPSSSTSSSKEMTMTATAYTAYCTGCSGTTYTGIDLRSNPNQKVIAVDPNVIPLGSKVWVEGYGEAIAGDIGSAIKGNIIDVFIEHQQDALNWGRKTVKIKILD